MSPTERCKKVQEGTRTKEEFEQDPCDAFMERQRVEVSGSEQMSRVGEQVKCISKHMMQHFVCVRKCKIERIGLNESHPVHVQQVQHEHGGGISLDSLQTRDLKALENLHRCRCTSLIGAPCGLADINGHGQSPRASQRVGKREGCPCFWGGERVC